LKLFDEFREFIARGNVVDLAVGVIIGGAFGKIVNSLVDQVIMPPIGLALGRVDFSELKIVLQHADPAEKTAAVAINYGSFVNTIIQFIIVAAVVFLMVKFINSIRRRRLPRRAPSGADPDRSPAHRDPRPAGQAADLLTGRARLGRKWMINVKICGLTTPEAVDAAIEGGATFVGFMFFAASPRAIDPEAAARLAERARGKAAIVAVTVDPDDVLIDRCGSRCGPTSSSCTAARPGAGAAGRRCAPAPG
jgi:large conductance mechanosensitive channel